MNYDAFKSQPTSLLAQHKSIQKLKKVKCVPTYSEEVKCCARADLLDRETAARTLDFNKSVVEITQALRPDEVKHCLDYFVYSKLIGYDEDQKINALKLKVSTSPDFDDLLLIVDDIYAGFNSLTEEGMLKLSRMVL